MSWVYLVIAGIFAIVWAIGLKYTEGFTESAVKPLASALGI